MLNDTLTIQLKMPASSHADTNKLQQYFQEMLDAAARPMTYQEFLAWADEDTLAEWEAGKVIMASPASSQHQRISKFLTNLLDLYVQSRALGEVIPAPFQMKLQNGREPDLMFVKREHLERLQATYLDGPADLAVEIISPESADRDRGIKFYEYAEGGVTEYWLLDPQAQYAEFYQLQQNYYLQKFSGHTGRYTSAALPGFWLDVAWLWQDPLPSPLRVLAEIVGMEAQVIADFERALTGESA